MSKVVNYESRSVNPVSLQKQTRWTWAQNLDSRIGEVVGLDSGVARLLLWPKEKNHPEARLGTTYEMRWRG